MMSGLGHIRPSRHKQQYKSAVAAPQNPNVLSQQIASNLFSLRSGLLKMPVTQEVKELIFIKKFPKSSSISKKPMLFQLSIHYMFFMLFLIFAWTTGYAQGIRLSFLFPYFVFSYLLIQLAR